MDADYTWFSLCTLLFIVGEEVIDGWHDFWGACAEELAEAVLCVLLPFFFIVKNSSGTMGFVDSATNPYNSISQVLNHSPSDFSES